MSEPAPKLPFETQAQPRRRVVLVTGLSGAGKSTALKALEDAGYEAVDNLPLSLLGALVAPEAGRARPIAIGQDTRARDFAVQPFLAAVERLREVASLDVRVMFLDCDAEILRRRYTETRRRHPLAPDRPVNDGIRAERALLEPVRARSDLVIDTTALSQGELKQLVLGHLGLDAAQGLAVSVMSFAYRFGLPREADLVFDVRFLMNPHYVAALRPRTGREREVGEYIERDPGFVPFFATLTSLVASLLPRFEDEGKSYLTVALGCTGGRHRSVFVAERLAERLASLGRRVTVTHRDIERAA